MATNNRPTNPYHEFLRMVWKMRKAQKEFYKYKSNIALQSSKRLETEVDKWMEQAGFEAAKIKQMAMPVEEPPKGE